MPEQNIVEKTRDILVRLKGYPDPANCKKNIGDLIVYAQDDYKNNSELSELLAHSSKCNRKDTKEYLWTENASSGTPEFLIINRQSNLAIVIECKPPSKNNHMSTFLRDENILVCKPEIIGKYAMDGALHYAKFLSAKYDVIALGISAHPNIDDLNITSFYWEKGKEIKYGEKNIEKTVKNKETGEKEKVIEKLKCCYGPFINIKLDSIQSYSFYKDFLNKETKKIIKEFNEEKAMVAATELNVILDGAGVAPTLRALLISGLLLALRDKTFQITYQNKEISTEELQGNLHAAIERIVNSEDIQDAFKKKVLKDKFNDAFNQQDLIDDNASKLRQVLEKLDKTIFPCMNGEYSIDVIGKFYHEFLSYAKNGQNSGIKLTPAQTTELFCYLADLKVDDTLMDCCLGTGGFLIAGMNMMYKLADEMTEREIEEFFAEKLSIGDITKKDINRMKSVNKGLYNSEALTINDVKQFIRKNQLVGCESDNIMYTLGCSNMILRGDGKSNILLGDCFKRETELKNFEATVGFINPPYSESSYNVMEFVELMCRCVKKKSKVVVIVPTSAAHSEEYLSIRNRILESNKLLGVMSMSEELFRGIADTVTCIMVFETGTAHNYNDTVYFGNWKEDGYYWHKVLGMIPDNESRHFSKTPEQYMKLWLKSFNNKNIDDEYGCWKKLIKNGNGICYDEWLWEYFVETDYSKLTQEDFEKNIKQYMIYQLKQLEITELTNESEEKEEDIEAKSIDIDSLQEEKVNEIS